MYIQLGEFYPQKAALVAKSVAEGNRFSRMSFDNSVVEEPSMTSTTERARLIGCREQAECGAHVIRNFDSDGVAKHGRLYLSAATLTCLCETERRCFLQSTGAHRLQRTVRRGGQRARRAIKLRDLLLTPLRRR